MTHTPNLGTPESDIIAALSHPLSIQELIDVTGQEREALRRRVAALKNEGLLRPIIEDGHISYARAARKPKRPPTSRRVNNPTTNGTRPAPSPAPAPMRGKAYANRTSLSNDVRRILAAAPGGLKYGEICRLLPQYRGNQIGSVLSQRTKVGEFIATPAEGKGRRYSLAEGAQVPAAGGMMREQILAELTDQVAFLRETANGLQVAAERAARILESLKA